MRVRIRYDSPDEKGETRRERAARFGLEDDSPAFNLSPGCWYLWEWFWTISGRQRRVRDGVVYPIPATEFLAWCEASHTIVTAPEYAILSAMDDVFCDETRQEIDAYQEREKERSRAKTDNMPWRKR